MGCNCGKPKCDGHCGVSPAVLQINNPSECTLFHRVEVPASMGDSKTNPPKNGAYKNVLLYYEADQTSWLYSSDGIPQKLVNGLTNYEDAINLPQINGVTLIGDKSLGDLGITDAIDDAVAEEKAEREAADEELADDIADKLSKKVDYYHITSESTMQDIVDAFSGNQAKVIEFDAGTYTLTSHIFIGSNTKVNLNGAVISRGDSSNMLFGYTLDTTVTGYNGVHNVEFNNGTIDASMALMHNVDFTFTNVTFGPNLTTHAIQIAGSKNIKFESCNFKGRILSGSVTSSQEESVQIETCTQAGQPWLTDPDSVSYDDSGNEDIEFNSCVFDSGSDANYTIYCGIGHHSENANNPYTVENIVVKNCKFGNATWAPIAPAGWSHYQILDNVFEYTGTATNMFIVRNRYANRYGRIANNTFTGGTIAMNNSNLKACHDLVFENNTVNMTTDSSHGIDIVGWTNVTVRNNKFIGSKGNFINVYTSSNILVENLAIENNIFNETLTTTSHVVYLADANNVTITNNTAYLSGDQYFVGLGDNFGSGHIIKYSRNIIMDSNPHVHQIRTASVLPSPVYIYDVPMALYNGATASYTALTNQAPTYNFSDFNGLALKIHKTGNAEIKTEYKINAWNFGRRLSDARRFYVSLPDSDGTMMLATFTINSDGTFSYVSSTSNLTLRSIYGYNTNLYTN